MELLKLRAMLVEGVERVSETALRDELERGAGKVVEHIDRAALRTISDILK
jgi:hypothetical protein